MFLYNLFIEGKNRKKKKKQERKESIIDLSMNQKHFSHI